MSNIQVPPDSTGKLVDTVAVSDAGSDVHRQKIVLAGGSGTAEVVVVTNAAPAAGDMGLVVRQAGTASVAIATPFTIQGISTTVNVAVATPFTLQGISTTVQVAIATPFTVNNISATVQVAKGPVAVPSVSHGPASVIASTSASVTLVASPGAGQSIHITSLAISNAGTVGALARIGTSASAGAVNMFCASAGGGFVLNFDPPWKLSASEAAVCSVKPNSGGNTHFNVNFYVSA